MKKNFFKVISLMLSLMIVVTTLFVGVVFTVSGNDSTEITYYVTSGGAGTKDGLSLENAAPSITKVVNYVNKANMTEGNVKHYEYSIVYTLNGMELCTLGKINQKTFLKLIVFISISVHPLRRKWISVWSGSPV